MDSLSQILFPYRARKHLLYISHIKCYETSVIGSVTLRKVKGSTCLCVWYDHFRSFIDEHAVSCGTWAIYDKYPLDSEQWYQYKCSPERSSIIRKYNNALTSYIKQYKCSPEMFALNDIWLVHLYITPRVRCHNRRSLLFRGTCYHTFDFPSIHVLLNNIYSRFLVCNWSKWLLIIGRMTAFFRSLHKIASFVWSLQVLSDIDSVLWVKLCSIMLNSRLNYFYD